jgi:hypothetical protein
MNNPRETKSSHLSEHVIVRGQFFAAQQNRPGNGLHAFGLKKLPNAQSLKARSWF